jgi:hypothetical protein
MAKESLDLKEGFIFKQLFGQPSRKRMTITFLNGLLNRIGRNRIDDVQENTELPKEKRKNQMNIVKLKHS